MLGDESLDLIGSLASTRAKMNRGSPTARATVAARAPSQSVITIVERKACWAAVRAIVTTIPPRRQVTPSMTAPFAPVSLTEGRSAA